jgi:hypothetical protein
VQAVSISPFAAELINGQPQSGVGLGHDYVLFGRQVIALTPPGRLRMPNGIETALVVAESERVSIGGGRLRTERAAIAAGPLWDPRPERRVALSLRPRPRIDLDGLVGRGPGLTPLGDDILVGYLAAAALAGAGGSAIACAARAARRTTALSRTLLYLAAHGALPEAAHHLLVDGDPGPLLAFGASSGKGIAFGLALFGVGAAAVAAAERVVALGDCDLVIGMSTTRPTLSAVAYA